MPNFTKIPKEFRESYKEKFNLSDDKEIEKRASEDPVVFAYYLLGKTVRLHQAYIIHKILTAPNRRIAVCWARQLGKSIALGIFLVWTCWYNKYPVTISNITVNYLVSKEDDAAVEFLEKIRLILYDADRHMAKLTDNDSFFMGSLKEPNNMHQITFYNNCFIKSIPPTMKAVGKSASWLVIDEAHRLRCMEHSSDTFFDLASAIVAETGGGIILSSSPEGIIGFFHRAIDPEKQYPENEYESFWFDHSIWDDDSKECIRYQKFVQSEKKRMTAAGRFKFWQQEYGSLFTVTETSFFEHEDIKDALEDTPQLYEYKDNPCSVAYDYGMKESRTVITIRTKWKDKETQKDEIIQLFQYRCPAGFDNNKLHEESWEHSIQNLKERYDLDQHGVFCDDCPNGNDHNNWMKEHAGIPVTLYNFRSDQMSKKDGLNRNCVAYSYKARLKEGILKIPKWNEIQQHEMKIVQETEQKVLITIKAPQGQLCDTFDSDMMACIPFLDVKGAIEFQFEIPKTSDDIKRENERKYGLGYDSFKGLTDEQCKEIIRQRKEMMKNGFKH